MLRSDTWQRSARRRSGSAASSLLQLRDAAAGKLPHEGEDLVAQLLIGNSRGACVGGGGGTAGPRVPL